LNSYKRSSSCIYAFLTLFPAFFKRNLFKRAIPQAVLEFGRPPEMVGRYEELKAPMPLRTTARAVAEVTFLVGYFLLCSAILLRIVVRVDALKVMLFALDFEAALPCLFFLLPRILSAFGAGV